MVEKKNADYKKIVAEELANCGECERGCTLICRLSVAGRIIDIIKKALAKAEGSP